MSKASDEKAMQVAGMIAAKNNRPASRKAMAQQAREDRQILELGKIVAVHLETINAQCAGNARKLEQLQKKRGAMLAKLEPWQIGELRLVGMAIERMAAGAQ